MKIETADIVKHVPSDETWQVAIVSGDELSPCGWPESIAKLSDCELVTKASSLERAELIGRLVTLPEPDWRGRRAREQFGEGADR